jgi:hypothetical protein
MSRIRHTASTNLGQSPNAMPQVGMNWQITRVLDVKARTPTLHTRGQRTAMNASYSTVTECDLEHRDGFGTGTLGSAAFRVRDLLAFV